MHAISARVPTDRPAAFHLSRWSTHDARALLTPESFRERLEAEVARHDRYLVPFGLVRIGPRAGRQGVNALKEAAAEIRRTDAACALPDGSCALLILHAGAGPLRAVARRLLLTAAQIERERGDDPTPLFAAIHAVGDRRIDADSIWLALGHAYAQCRSSRETLAVVS